MSESNVTDENNITTEQNSMVQRIALEVKRREPSSVKYFLLLVPALKLYFSCID